ncbi:DUF4352 domain-containing protein [Salinicoccus roseus]|uniref:DUF4352 domain-containing protein n=1 Tax=Salinicoccus roseus TaxID=45670 RepID=A0A0C2E3E0_9STAP|nr:DUF4352 domain-containing protein [Salinicoccus roseus]KIH69957.1 hypothetical protein SN16_10640 [Salinicoccus roseus]MDB0581257.1 DUF4352 domain-containing protein [Salinicoccus roseus]
MAEEKQKKKGGCLKWGAIIIGVLILFGACAAAMTGGGEDTGDTSSDSNEAETTETATEESTEEETEEATEEVVEEESPDAGIGEQLDVGAMSYTVNEVTTASQVGPSAFPTTANETYVVIDLTVTNNGNEAVTVDSTYFKMIIDGATFDADSAASMSANQNENGEITNSFFLENLNPGSTMSGKIVFDVSQANADNPEKALQVQEGIFGTNSGTINLQ